MGESVAERTANGEGGATDELFPEGSVQGDEKTLKAIMDGRLPVAVTVSMKSAEVPARGGLLDPNRQGVVLVRYAPQKYEVVPERDHDSDAERVTGWKVRQVLRPVYVERTSAQGASIEGAFEALLGDDAQEAGKLLDRLQKRAKAALKPSPTAA